MTVRRFIEVLIAIAPLAGCSAGHSEQGGAGGTGTNGPQQGTATGSSAAGGQDCSTQSSQSACVQCCVSAHGSGASAYDSALVKNCACNSGATCNSKCSGDGDVCKSSDLSSVTQGCANCLDGIQQSDGCEKGFQSDCKASSDCMTFLMCAAGCPKM
jgi:hypothetical protein